MRSEEEGVSSPDRVLYGWGFFMSEQLIFIFFECKQQNDAEKTTGDDFSDCYGHCGKPHRDDAVSVF